MSDSPSASVTFTSYADGAPTTATFFTSDAEDDAVTIELDEHEGAQVSGLVVGLVLKQSGRPLARPDGE